MHNISVEELKAKIDAKEPMNLIDVREVEEHKDFNVGGMNITLRTIQDMAIEPIEHLKNEEVICYCRSGKRSVMAGLMLEHMGFSNVVNVVGGMLEWQEKFVK
jgi:rhodanese-related sulfurtransferase